MSLRIACYTLFDITKTGVLNRARPGIEIQDADSWFHKRNTQCNFDTILQVIGLRSQPDVMSDPKLVTIKFDEDCQFGYLYRDKKIRNAWTFDFEIQHPSVFEDGIDELGSLYKDCQGVPMIKCPTSWDKLGTTLDTNIATRNIYFVKY